MSIRSELPRLVPTDPSIYRNRREFVRTLGVGLAGLGLGGPASLAAGRQPGAEAEAGDDPIRVPLDRPDVFPPPRHADFDPDLTMTPRRVAATHNNFYEFLPGRGGPVHRHVEDFEVDPWSVVVEGACARPRTFDLDDLFGFEHEERVYRFRCVETWAMNVPWSGFPLSRLLDAVEPTSDAKFVRFVTANRPEQMPGMRQADWYPWPYFEALRMDEARNPLTLVVTGIFGEPLLKQHGAPVRIIVPWKYGYKSPKSIVRIELTEDKPPTFWNRVTPREYGFLSNVNPNVPHPRWSQAEEYLLGDRADKRPTRIFNGYGEFVADLYPDEPREPLDEAPQPPR